MQRTLREGLERVRDGMETLKKVAAGLAGALLLLTILVVISILVALNARSMLSFFYSLTIDWYAFVCDIFQ